MEPDATGTSSLRDEALARALAAAHDALAAKIALIETEQAAGALPPAAGGRAGQGCAGRV